MLSGGDVELTSSLTANAEDTTVTDSRSTHHINTVLRQYQPAMSADEESDIYSDCTWLESSLTDDADRHRQQTLRPLHGNVYT